MNYNGPSSTIVLSANQPIGGLPATAYLEYKPGVRLYSSSSEKNVAAKDRFESMKAYLVIPNTQTTTVMMEIIEKSFTIKSEVKEAEKIGRGKWLLQIVFNIEYHPRKGLTKFERDLFEKGLVTRASFLDTKTKTTINGVFYLTIKVRPGQESILNEKNGGPVETKQEKINCDFCKDKSVGCKECNLIDLSDEPEPQSNDRPVNPFAYWNDFPISRFNNRNPFYQNKRLIKNNI